MSDLAEMSYADLLDSLRKDLQLDAATDMLPGSLRLAMSGDPASIYLAATIASWGPGTGNPWASGGYTVGIDTGKRISSGTYVCRNTGVYAVSSHVGFGLPAGGQFSLLFQNVTSGYCYEATDARSAGVAAVSGISGATLLPALAGQVLQVQFNTTLNVTVQNLGSTSHVGTWCNFQQVA